jgi:hypothetical protein
MSGGGTSLHKCNSQKTAVRRPRPGCKDRLRQVWVKTQTAVLMDSEGAYGE